MLKVAGIHVYYGKIQALRDVYLEVQEEEMVTLIGANGAGKTTILNTISGLIHPRCGEIDFMGKKIGGFPPAEIVKMGISQCPEGRKIWPEMTVLENLEMGAYVRQDEKVQEDLERIYFYFPILKERSRQFAGRLSGGEQQMLAMGRALMSRPKLFLLDEPSLGLAPLMVKKTASIIKEIHREKTTVFLVEQNAFLALNMCNRGYVLETGKMVNQGKTADLLQDAQVKKAYLGEIQRKGIPT
jgi:branched-chain amino acid transport system ATP-binding protein